MQDWQRYAVFAVPEGRFYETGSEWLGWDSVAGATRAQPALPGLPLPISDLTKRPGKYGLHGTLKPPFRLAEGETLPALKAAIAKIAAAAEPVDIAGLRVSAMGRFLALVPAGSEEAVSALAAHVVTGLAPFRAPLTASEMEKRRADRMGPRAAALLAQYGYPYVLDQFRFHLTLTGPVPKPTRGAVANCLSSHFAPVLPRPYRIADLALMGQDRSGRFHLLDRFPLGGR